MAGGNLTTNENWIKQEIYKLSGTVFNIEKVDDKNIATLRFTNNFDVEVMRDLNPKLLNAALRFKIEPNKEYEELLKENGRVREASISKWRVTEITDDSLKVQLFFKDLEAISEGGVAYQDSLAVWIAELETLKFQKKTIKIRNKDYQLVPFMVPQKPQFIIIP